MGWGEFTVYFDQGVLLHWSLAAFVFDGTSQTPLSAQELVGVTTEKGIGIGATDAELRAAHSDVALVQGTPADTNSYTDSVGRTYTFMAPAGPGLYFAQPLWDCEGGE
jgi:hypothetical protein